MDTHCCEMLPANLFPRVAKCLLGPLSRMAQFGPILSFVIVHNSMFLSRSIAVLRHGGCEFMLEMLH